jgi:hypothetical protein
MSLILTFLCVYIWLFVLFLPSFLSGQSYGFEDFVCHTKVARFCVLCVCVVSFVEVLKKPYVCTCIAFCVEWHYSCVR